MSERVAGKTNRAANSRRT